MHRTISVLGVSLFVLAMPLVALANSGGPHGS
jgi:hypothetical protein